jgi:hypothetical protein
MSTRVTAIVTTTYRCKRPPRKRAKAAAIEAPANRSRRSGAMAAATSGLT